MSSYESVKVSTVAERSRKRKHLLNKRGSLSLEQALFIGAIVAMFAGVSIFYDNLGKYFSSITFVNPPQSVGTLHSQN